MLMLQFHYLYFLRHNINSRIFGQKQPLLAGFKITYRCTLKCRSCPFWRMEPLSISYHRAVEIMDEFHRKGVRLLIFEGGEPFLWRDGKYCLEDLVKYAKQKFFRVGITTNGTLPIESSADVIWISIDGLKDTHEQNRGECFDRVIVNIKASSRLQLLANITITRLNHQEIPGLVKFLAPIVKGITIQFYYPFPNSDDLWLPELERIAVLDQLIDLKKQGYPILDSISALQGLKENTWRCHDWLIASAEPDGSINIGCYLKNRAEISCEKCGFAAHTELSKAYDWNFGAILVGHKTFKFRFI